MTERSRYILQCSQTSSPPKHPNMKLFVMAVCALVACAQADVSHVVRSPEQEASVLRSESKVEPESYHYAFETSNGIAAQADGQLKSIDNLQAVVAQGSFQFVAPDGTPVQTSYVADENGYQPQGAHIPTPPPIPDYIIRSIEYARTHQPKEGSRP